MRDPGDEAQYKTSDNLAARADLFKRFGAGGRGWHAWVFDHLLAADLPDDARIADLGGGPGWLSQQRRSAIRFAFIGSIPRQIQGISSTRLALSLPDKPSIAALPFTNLSGDQNSSHSLSVTAPTSSAGSVMVTARR